MSRMTRIIVFIIVLFCVPLWACKKDIVAVPVDITFIVHKWEVLSITAPGASQPQKSPKPYIFEFYNVKQLSISLDVNGCSALFDIPKTGKIAIVWHGCEKVCCDSDYANAMAQLVPKLTGYEVKGDTLTLIGAGQISLKQL